MGNPRAVLIKKLLSERGPQTITSLHEGLLQAYPAEFAGVTKTNIKKVYLKNLKALGQIRATPSSHKAISEKLLQSPDGFTLKDSSSWLWSIQPELEEKYRSMSDEEAKTQITNIIKTINAERGKGKDFWDGRINTPSDWKAVLKEQGKKTSY
ncbi:hypothetical protein AX774_g2646 [Zancudomyces culisetae]|uniref:Uncharacterized protein n=1 Tax=Zancudomyces culisetae TaxID=1213189 RepID=A0A1R1PS71_ZANCU|nr:hypothetical protein AX774_g2646 [Zancudomyces culisetae]|eukprot:OMH83836.1 hypothetical protein AX774_g2646 [Zancudomyces culisetae]